MTVVIADLPCACGGLRKATRVVTRLYDEALAAYGLTVTQYAILHAIARLGAPTLSELARDQAMDRTSLYRTLAPMIEQGWVGADTAASGRAKVASLTSAGRELMARAETGWRVAQDGFVGAFGADEWAVVSAALQRVIDVAGAAA